VRNRLLRDLDRRRAGEQLGFGEKLDSRVRQVKEDAQPSHPERILCGGQELPADCEHLMASGITVGEQEGEEPLPVVLKGGDVGMMAVLLR
jgi:hypothetical protein